MAFRKPLAGGFALLSLALAGLLSATALAHHRPDHCRGKDPCAQTTTDGTTTTGGTTSTTEEPPVAVSGSLLFEDGFERGFVNSEHDVGNFDYTQTSCFDGDNRNNPIEAISFVDGLRAGSKAMRIRLDGDDRSSVASGNEACEVTKIRESYRLGKTEFYGHRFRMGAGYSTSNWWTFVSQLAYPTVKYHNLGLEPLNGIQFTALNGKWLGSGYEHVTWKQPLAPLDANRWHDFIIEVKWATRPEGHVRVWHRLDGTGAFALVYQELGVPTQQWGSTEYSCVTVEGLNCGSLTPRVTLDKIGAYRPYAAGQTPLVVDHDVFVLGTSFAVVAQRLDGS